MTSNKHKTYVYGLYALGRDYPLFYVGKGNNRRMFRHSKEPGQNAYKDRTITKYSSYCMPIYGGLTDFFAGKLEEKLIALYKTQLTNILPGGRSLGRLGVKHSPETCKKMSANQLGMQNSHCKYSDSFVKLALRMFKKANLSQAKFAAQLGIKRTTLQAWLNGRARAC